METIPTIRMADCEEYVSQRRPCLIADGLASCERLRQWTPEHLADMCGDAQVSVYVSFQRLRDAASAAERKRPYVLSNVRLRDAARWITSAALTDRELYCPQEPMMKFQSLCTDVTFWKPLSEARVHMWFGTANTVSALHHDFSLNMFAQVVGEKRFILFSPDQVKSLYPKDGEESHMSAVDPVRPDLEAHPRFAEATPMVVTVRAGEILFIPSFWWHHVTSLAVSISLNQWSRPDLHEYCNRTGARLMMHEYLKDGWSDFLRTRKILLNDLLVFAEKAAAVDQAMPALALNVVLDHYDRWPDHVHTPVSVEGDVRQAVEHLKQALLDDSVYEIDQDTVAALARRVCHDSVLGAFARAAQGAPERPRVATPPLAGALRGAGHDHTS